MTNQALQLAFITQSAHHAEAVKQVTSPRGWQLLPFVGQPVPAEWLHRLSVDVFLVGLDAPNATAIIRDLVAVRPDTPVIAVATSDYLIELQNAMLAGARDFIALPLSGERFVATVQKTLQVSGGTALVPAATPISTALTKRGRLVAVTGLRGGVGRTSLAVNLAVAMHQRHMVDVVLAEAHHDLSNVSLMLNLHPRHNLSMLDSGEIDFDMIRGYLQPHSTGIRVLTAPNSLEQLVDLAGDVWHRTLNLLADVAPMVIVDTGSSADGVLSEVLLRADDVIVMAVPEIASLRSAMSLLRVLQTEEQVKARVHMVLNRVGIGGGLDEATIRKQLGYDIAVSIPDDPALATYALNRGVPYVVSHPRAIMSRRTHHLVDHLLGRIPQAERAEANGSRSLLSFLSRSR